MQTCQLLYCKAASWYGLRTYSTRDECHSAVTVIVCSVVTSQASERRVFLVLCPFLPSTGGTSLELLRVLIPQKLSTWQWNTAFWRTWRIQLSKKVFLFLRVRPWKHLALRDQPSVNLLQAAQYFIPSVPEGLHSWLNNPTCAEAQQPWAFQQGHWRALEKGTLLSTQAASGVAGMTGSFPSEDGKFHLLSSFCSLKYRAWQLLLSYIIFTLHQCFLEV